jgi:2-methylcitrate dehydratase
MITKGGVQAKTRSLAMEYIKDGEPLSQWKGFSPGMTGMRAIYAASLARRGFTGPKGLLEGPYGLERMFAQSIPVNWEDPSFEIVTQTVMKKYCSLIHGQPMLEAVLDLKRRNSLVTADVEHVRCDAYQAASDFAGGGYYGSKDHPQTKEQGDYNKYLIAAALLDDQVGPAQLQSERIQAPDAQAMIARVEVHPDQQLTARYPQELSARITIRTKDQRVLVTEHLGYEGGLGKPISWDRTVEKFHWLSEPYAEEELRNRIINFVLQLDNIAVSDLTDLLAQIRPSAVLPTSHPGIQ